MVEKRLTVLEHYEKKGLLENQESKYTAEDRVRVGLRLGEDFYKARISSVSAIDYSKERVDNSAKSEPDYVLDARDRYSKAINSIPADFFHAVSEVCCHNRLLKGRGLTERQRRYDRYMRICDLRRGLDYLIKFYLGIGKKSY